MKHIIVYKYRATNMIKKVEIDEKHTKEELISAIEEFNNDSEELSVELLDFEEENIYCQMMLFFLGKDRYKILYEVDTLISTIDELKEDFDNTATEIDRMRWKLEDCCKQVKELVEEKKQ